MVASVWYFLNLLAVSAQGKDSLFLPEVDIHTDRFKQFGIGEKSLALDSLQLVISSAHTLSDVLTEQTQVFVKNYGPGNIATPSLRGTGAEHTALLWNGFNLQSPMLGLVDISIIPMASGDELSVQYGGNGALYGSGAIGGAIHIRSHPIYMLKSGAEINFTAGSFGNLRQMLSVYNGNKRRYNILKLTNQNITNNFTFHNPYLSGNPEQKQTHALVNQQAIISENHFRITANSEFNFRIWAQQTHRQIPPTLSIPVSTAEQTDKSLRFTSEYSQQGYKQSWLLRTGFFYDKLNYSDTLKSINSRSNTFTQNTECEKSLILPQHILVTFGLNNTYNQVSTEVYKNERRNRFAQIIAMKWHSEKEVFRIGFSFRTEFINTKFLPVMPSLGCSYQLNKQIMIAGNINRSYRVPTFNEMFWTPGGNPNLAAESGWGEEISLKYYTQIKQINFEMMLTGFNRNINNWIQWIPDSTYWKPVNLNHVTNKGIECMAKIQFPILTHMRFNMQYMFNFIQSTTTNATNHLDYQLPYIPRMTQQIQGSVTWKKLYLSYIQYYTGMRYTNADNTAATDDFSIGNLKSGYHFTFSKMSISCFAEINNIGNISYVVYPDRPMPMRNFLTGLTFKF